MEEIMQRFQIKGFIQKIIVVMNIKRASIIHKDKIRVLNKLTLKKFFVGRSKLYCSDEVIRLTHVTKLSRRFRT